MKIYNPVKVLVFGLLMAAFLSPSSHLLASSAVQELQPGLHDVAYKNARYLVFLPLNFSSDKKYPLIVISFMYSGVPEIDVHEIMDSWSRVAEEREYVVVLPIVGGIDEKVIEWYRDLLKDVKTAYSIDRRRVLLTGFGEGAEFAYYLGTTIPEEFAAISPVCGTLNNRWERRIYYKKGNRKPFFILAGELDSKAVPSEMKASADKLKKKGYEVTYEELSGGSHDYSDTMTQKVADWFSNLE